MGIQVSRKSKIRLTHFVVPAIRAAVIVSILNCIYVLIYQGYTHFTFKEFVNYKAIIGLSILSSFLGAFGYYLIFKLSQKPVLVFSIFVLVVLGLSLLVPSSERYPDGSFKMEYDEFFWLTVPMHFITAFLILYVVPSSVSRKLETMH